MQPFQLLLASASPRRAAILETLGLPFQLVNSTFEEPAATPTDDHQPAAYVMRLAREKAAHAQVATHAESADIRPQPQRTRLVLAADTIVWHDGEILGKPRDEDHAVKMLKRLRGHAHQVLTGVCLRVIRGGNVEDEYHVAYDATEVHFRLVNDEWIKRYVQTGEPLDKAGAYAAQGRGAVIVERINGDFWNVVGLPLATLASLLETVGSPFENWWEENGA